MNTGQTPYFLHLDEDLYVAYKPSGLHTVHQKESDKPSLESWINKELSVESLKEAGLLQRLDFYTCGCVLGARNEKMHALLLKALKDNQIEKSYLALVEGELTQDIELKTWIGSPYRRSKKMKVITSDKQAKRFLEARSRIRSLSVNKELSVSLVDVSAPKARRHQVRAHLAHLGHPLLGDSLYGAKDSLQLIAINREGFILIAETISLQHPILHKELRIQCELPESLKRAFSDHFKNKSH